jgi:hypothetical protein
MTIWFPPSFMVSARHLGACSKAIINLVGTQ